MGAELVAAATSLVFMPGVCAPCAPASVELATTMPNPRNTRLAVLMLDLARDFILLFRPLIGIEVNW